MCAMLEVESWIIKTLLKKNLQKIFAPSHFKNKGGRIRVAQKGQEGQNVFGAGFTVRKLAIATSANDGAICGGRCRAGRAHGLIGHRVPTPISGNTNYRK
jgi:hypothetical protein